MQKRVTVNLQGKHRMDWATDNFECLFVVSIVDTCFVGQPRERSETARHEMTVGMTWKLRVNWSLDSDGAEMDAVKVLFEHSIEYVKGRLQNGLPLEDELLLTMENSAVRCPYDISRIADPTTPASFEVCVETGRTDHRMSAGGVLQVQATESAFVNEGRIKELREIASSNFDLSKLIRFCEELNISYANDCSLSVAMLGRAVLDHVPPIFDRKRFSEVVNNYEGSQSFKKSMSHLHNSLRSIANRHLHGQIRKKESLPNMTQVGFSPELDVLLEEIVRLLK